MNKEFLRSDRKPEYMKGIKNRKVRFRTVHKHSEHIEGDEFAMNDGTTYKVRYDGAWLRTSKKKGEK